MIKIRNTKQFIRVSYSFKNTSFQRSIIRLNTDLGNVRISKDEFVGDFVTDVDMDISEDEGEIEIQKHLDCNQSEE